MSNTDVTRRPTALTGGGELDDFVTDHDVALVEFYTKGCPKCQAMEPVLGNVARSTDVHVATVNPGDDVSLIGDFSLRSVPALVLFRDGEEVARLVDGFVGVERVLEFVEDNR